MTAHIIDPDDFCRACDGAKGGWEATGRGPRIWEPCFDCGGSGRRTVLVWEAE